MSRNKSHYFIQTLHKFEVHFIKIIFGHMWRLKSCQKQFSLAKSYNLQFSACSKTLYHLQQLRLSFSYWFLVFNMNVCMNIDLFVLSFFRRWIWMYAKYVFARPLISTNMQRKLGNRAWYLTTSQEAWGWFSSKPDKFLPPCALNHRLIPILSYEFKPLFIFPICHKRR